MQYIFSLLILVFAFIGFIHFIKACISNFKEYIEKLRVQKYGSDTTNTADNTSSSDT